MSKLKIRFASKHSLNQRRGFDELMCSRKPRRLEHHFIHISQFLLLERTKFDVSPRRNSFRARVLWSSHSIGESGLDLWTGVQRSQHNDRSDGGAGKFRGDIGGNSGKA